MTEYVLKTVVLKINVASLSSQNINNVEKSLNGALKIRQWLLINSNKILFQEPIFINICAKLFDTFRFCIMNYNDDQKLNANPNLVSFYHYHTENSILFQRLKWATFSPHYSLNLRQFILNHSYQLARWHNALDNPCNL